jgi:hypothetical protein
MGTRASACFKTATICSTVNRLCFTANFPSRDIRFCRKLTFRVVQKYRGRSAQPPMGRGSRMADRREPKATGVPQEQAAGSRAPSVDGSCCMQSARFQSPPAPLSANRKSLRSSTHPAASRQNFRSTRSPMDWRAQCTASPCPRSPAISAALWPRTPGRCVNECVPEFLATTSHPPASRSPHCCRASSPLGSPSISGYTHALEGHARRPLF